MQDAPPYDARIIANEIIDLAREYGIAVTHLSLQKIVYFLHESFLKENGKPLCFGHFQAWKHGPVHPQIWSSFKAAGRETIRQHAYGLCVVTGRPKNLPRVENSSVRLHIAAEALRLLRIPAHRLVGLSHATGGAWDLKTRTACGQREYGARISNDFILSCKAAKMIPVREDAEDEDDLYEQPPS